MDNLSNGRLLGEIVERGELRLRPRSILHRHFHFSRFWVFPAPSSMASYTTQYTLMPYLSFTCGEATQVRGWQQPVQLRSLGGGLWKTLHFCCETGAASGIRVCRFFRDFLQDFLVKQSTYVAGYIAVFHDMGLHSRMHFSDIFPQEAGSI